MVIGETVIELPGLIEAEIWSGMSGFQLEATTDEGGGQNTGFADLGDCLIVKIHR